MNRYLALTVGGLAAVAATSLPPINLSPGQDQPINCPSVLVGSLNDPVCATYTPTSTPTRTPTNTPSPTSTATNTPTPTVTPIAQMMAPGSRLLISCATGLLHQTDANGNEILACPLTAVTPQPIGTPLANAGSVFAIRNDTTQMVNAALILRDNAGTPVTTRVATFPPGVSTYGPIRASRAGSAEIQTDQPITAWVAGYATVTP